MEKFVDMNEYEMMNTDGGEPITGAMIVAGVGCVAAGVAIGYAIGKIVKWIF